MSTAILDAFVTLLTEQLEIILDRDDLQFQLNQPHEDLDELADMVAKYCQADPELQAALRSLLNSDPLRLPGKGNTSPALQVADYKYTILNTMHRVVVTPAPVNKP